MTEHSEFGGINDYDSSRFGDNLPCDAGMVRDNLANNSHHLYDASSQVRISWVAATTEERKAPDVDPVLRYHVVDIFGPFPLMLQTHGLTAPLVCRIGVTHGQVQTTKWRVVLMPLPGFPGVLTRVFQTSFLPPNEDEITSSFSVPTWVTIPKLLQLETWQTRDFTPDSARVQYIMPITDGGAVDSIIIIQAMIVVAVNTPTAAVIPELVGFHAREFIKDVP